VIQVTEGTNWYHLKALVWFPIRLSWSLWPYR